MIELLFTKIIEQLDLVLSSVLIALTIGIPVGIFVFSKKGLKQLVLNTASICWTIPSLALLAFFIPIMGIGVMPAIIVLSIYAILPILRNIIVGLESVPAASIEAASGLGLTKWQCLRMVELPLAFPVIIAGIRTAVSMSVGIATLAAFVGAGGLGDFINQGLAMNSRYLLLLGAIPAAMLALSLDSMIGFFEKDIQATHKKTFSHRVKQSVIYIGAMLIILFLINHWLYDSFKSTKNNTVVIASKNFTEQFILGQLIAQMLKVHTNLHIVEKFNLGTTAIVQAALLKSDVDMYPEYTGTAYGIVLHQTKIGTPTYVFNFVKQAYKANFNLIWLPPFGFNNTQAIIVKPSFAERFHLKTISDLANYNGSLTIAAPAEFEKRPDGLFGLTKVYNVHFRAVQQMDPGLMYDAIKNNNVNVVAGFSTDPQILAFHLINLTDNKLFYPPYYAAIVIREQTLKDHPEIYRVLKPLFGIIDDSAMQQMNYQVQIENKSPQVVAHNFLLQHKLIE